MEKAVTLQHRCGLDSDQRMVVRQGKLIEACINASFGSHRLRPVGGRRHRPRYTANACSGDVVRSFGSFCYGMGKSDAEAAAVALTASTIAMQGVGTQEEDNKEAGVTGGDFAGVFREATDERSCALTRKAWEGAFTIASNENDNSDMDWKPKIGMKFETIDKAWEFWNAYGGKIGFGVRRLFTNKSKKDGSITTCRFVCCKEGVRRANKGVRNVVNRRLETRTDCKVKMGLVNEDGKFKVYDFVEEHNHVLHLPNTTHMLPSHRRISDVQAQEIELAADSGLQQRAAYEFLSREAGGRGNLGFTRLDLKNYLRTRRQKSLIDGEAGCLLRYFQDQKFKDLLFFYDFQMDNEDQITNIFWADSRMILDYGHFGDVVSFDTTYCINNVHRPLAIFSGFNHFKGGVIFGAALLYDETADQAMAKALREVMPEVYHGLCTWHLMQNGIKHLGNLMKGGSHFLRDFKSCMYQYEEVTHFEEAWSKLLSHYNVEENTWLSSVYTLKEKWAACYMKSAFTLGMRSIQLSESLNANLKRYLTPNININEFFTHFERVVEDKRYNELVCEFNSRDKLPRMNYSLSPMVIRAAKVYTPPIFDEFQYEFNISLACSIKYKHESEAGFEYGIIIVGREVEFRVLFNPPLKAVSCSCKRFENFGILCGHALKVLDVNEIKIVPDQYILGRWTKNARSDVILDVKENEVEQDPKLIRIRRHRQLWPDLVYLTSEVIDSEEGFLLVAKGLKDLRKQAEELLEREKDVNNFKDDSIPPMSACTSQPMSASSSQPMGASSSQPKGIKKRQGNKRTRCYKNWVGQRKRTQRVPNSHSQRSINKQVVNQVNSHCIEGYENPFSFTRFLLEPLDLSTLSLGGFLLDGDNSNVNDQASQQS
ncbi:protein FAR1-RELATED SEQUENCE 5-like [Senna tora]|uniref:Protein FAR1-RELATED SEQUENCE 5-like n=1 Tax=Senna tora TaxID=362788 RepID=A0A834SPI6_9FABA|nr:protein FAR1-RELATED SEQUENCE 5-like [Senna tora]